METRPLGTTGQESSICTFGAIALNWLEQEGADQMVEFVLDRGVNHVDVAPAYGDAELKLAPKLGQHREEIFLGCKTDERDREGAAADLDRSLDRLGVETIDLYQIHGLERREELDRITDDDGALAAMREARDDGRVDHLGLTSHADPELIVEAIERIDDLETVMFPMNPVVAAKDDDEHDYGSVQRAAEDHDLGTLGIKAFAAGPWPPTDELPEDDRSYANWYEPVDTYEETRDRFDFAASRGLTSVITAGDPKLVTMAVDAAREFEPMDEAARRALVEAARHDDSPVPQQLHH